MKNKVLKMIYLLLIGFIFNSTVYASDTELLKTETITYVNPLYRDVISEDEIKSKSVAPKLYSATDSKVLSYDEAKASFRTQLKNRVETIEIAVSTNQDFNILVHSLFDDAVSHTGVSTEGDYIKWQYAYWEVSGYYISGGYGLTYTMYYYTTLEQEKKVTTEVKNTLNLLALYGTDYDKVNKIYNYITRNVTYDYKNLSDESYKLKYTAYAALINKTSVCQGYALLFYRMALESGIDTRLIAGYGNGGAHAWNIVKLGNYYYNVDSTWDAGRTNFSYFLKSNSNFTDHVRDAEYNTTAFNKKYVMDSANYNTEIKNGLIYNDSTKRWEYYKNDKPDYTYTGYASNANGTYYVQKGIVTFKYNALGKYNGKWTAIINSKINPTYTGIVSNSNGTYYLEKGNLSFAYNGTYTDKDGNVYVFKNSKVDKTFTGLKQVSGIWYYFKNGKTDFSYNGYARNGNGIYYVQKGKITFKYNSLVSYNGKWTAIINSKINPIYTGLASNSNGTYLVQNGTVTFNYNGKYTYNGKTYTIKNSKVV